jgi:hypothetical protein
VGCASEGEGRPDKDLGDLVISPVQTIPEVDIEEASKSSVALFAALRLPHTWVGERIGAHEVAGTTRLSVKEGQQPLEDLSDDLRLVFDDKGHYNATLDNSKDYGRHAVFDGTTLYLRPRFGKFHARPPQSETEADEIRNEIFAGATDYLELFESQIEVSDKGAKTLGGRAVREIALKLAPEPKKRKPYQLEQHAWRNTIEVQAIEGSVSLDAETGAPLSLTFEGRIAYERESRRFTMELAGTRTINQVGQKLSVLIPDETQLLRIPPRRRELAERESLLEGIAPPARKAPTPQAADPSGSP